MMFTQGRQPAVHLSVCQVPVPNGLFRFNPKVNRSSNEIHHVTILALFLLRFCSTQCQLILFFHLLSLRSERFCLRSHFVNRQGVLRSL